MRFEHLIDGLGGQPLRGTLSTNQDDFDPAGGDGRNRINNFFSIYDVTADIDISGFYRDAAKVPPDPFVFAFVNRGPNSVTLLHDSASSAAENRMLLPSGIDFVMPANTVQLFFYDNHAQRWMLIS